MILPVPNALIQTTMMLIAITFMYLSAKAVTDKEYRAEFIDPLLDEVRLTLVARDRYRSSTAEALNPRPTSEPYTSGSWPAACRWC